MRTLYYCEKCGKEFADQDFCQDHEDKCGKIYTFTCSKCGKEIKYILNSNTDQIDLWINSNMIWNIHLGRAGYGSKLDGCDIKFGLCDECLYQLIDSFTLEGQEQVHNSGSNQYLSSKDWIKAQKGELSEEAILAMYYSKNNE
jgi:DNA-directed RNA polymerase subunit RPC12/RpoP